jgi:hypothetical protein
LRSRLDGLLQVPHECLAPRTAVGRRGVEKRGELGVREGPARLPEAICSERGCREDDVLDGLQLLSNASEAVGYFHEIGRTAVESVGFSSPANRRVPGAEGLEMGHRLGGERNAVVGVKARGYIEARRDWTSSTRFVPPG